MNSFDKLLEVRKSATVNVLSKTKSNLEQLQDITPSSTHEIHFTTPNHRSLPSRCNNNILHRRHLKPNQSMMLDSEGKAHVIGSEAQEPSLYGHTMHSIPDTSTYERSRTTFTMKSQWQRAENIHRSVFAHGEANTSSAATDSSSTFKPMNGLSLDDGVWEIASSDFHFLLFVKHQFVKFVTVVVNWIRNIQKPTNGWESKSTFAVVTFTSRQAALTARHCLTDGKGHNQWITYESLPLPPLADSAPCEDFITCRNCCKPVTVTLGKNDVMARGCLTITMLILIYCFYVSYDRCLPFFQKDAGICRSISCIVNSIM